MNKDKNLFKTFYDELYKEILNEYYLEINNNIKKNKSNTITTYLFTAILPTILLWISFFNIKYILILIIISIIYNILIYLFIKQYYKTTKDKNLDQIKYKILDDLITLISSDETSQVIPNNRISKESFEKTNLFNLKNVNYTGSNFIQTTYENKNLVFADINIYTYIEKLKDEYFYIGNRKFLRTYKTKKKKDIFLGCYIGTDINKKNSALIQIIPNTLKDNIINNKINNYYNLCEYQVKLENLEFSKKYSVYTNHEIKARMVLTLTMMEKINELDKIITNKKYIIFKNDGRCAIFIEGLTFEDILNNNLTSKRNPEKEFENIYKVYKELLKLFEITKTLQENK